MKKRLLPVIALLLTALVFPAQAAKAARPILFGAYRQVGWGDRVQIACIDEMGGLWAAEGSDSVLHWPYKTEEQLTYMQEKGKLAQVGQLASDDLFDLKSLVASVKPQEGKPQPWACDAGTESVYAVRYGADGAAECVLLAMTGDDWFENTDPNAQALYLGLHRLFALTSYIGEYPGGWGFQPISLADFCGFGGLDLKDAVIAAQYNDCESGPQALEITETEEKALRRLAAEGRVTGKANATTTTGGTVSIVFRDPEGQYLCSFELYHGLLVRSDGMYTIE